MHDTVFEVAKAGTVDAAQVTDDQLKLINKFAIEPLTTDELFVFKVAAADTEIDRDFEVFTEPTLKKLAKLFVGKTVITNHESRAENQIARIYDTAVESTGGMTKSGEPGASLIFYCYMLKAEKNADFIAEIKAGIKKEVSISCRITKALCSICGKDNRKEWCEHISGVEYSADLCFRKLLDPTDAYEVSFVGVPAQLNAGVAKKYGATPPAVPPETEPRESPKTETIAEMLFKFKKMEE